MALKVTPRPAAGGLRFGSSIGGDVTGTLPGGTVVEQVNGLPPSWKNAVRAATTTAGTLATSFENGDTIDGEVLVTGDRILIKNQASGSQNGIYIVSTTGAPVRAPDMDEADEVLGAVVYVIEGTANAGTLWLNTNTTVPTLETTALTFSAFSSTPAGGFLEIINGGGGTVQAHGSLGATETIDTANGNYHWGTLNANCTFTFTTTVDTAERWFTLELIEDGTGGWTVTWPGSVVWLGGTTPAHTTTAGTTTIYAFFTRNGGTTWIGGQLGAGGSASFATPAIVLGTAAAAGVVTTVIRSDSTIVAFDATVPASVAAANATGSAAFAARRDHVHAVASTAGHWEVLMAGGISSPPEPLENGTGTDWLYAFVP